VSVGSHIFYRWRGDWGDPKSFRRPYLAAEAIERPARIERPDRPAVRTAGRSDPGETTKAFGVTIRRGGPPPVFLAAAEAQAPPAPPPNAAGVRVHAGLPEFVESAPAESAQPAAEVAVR
jgi:hypothetical protein